MRSLNQLQQHADVYIFYTESSDDSYVSAEEDPLEAPLFEFPLQDTVASSGTEVLLKCIISGNPLPEGKFSAEKLLSP